MVHGSLNWSNFHWNLSFVRVVQDWEIQSSVCFRDILCTAKVGWEGEDKLIWVLYITMVLEVKTFVRNWRVVILFLEEVIGRIKSLVRVGFL